MKRQYCHSLSCVFSSQMRKFKRSNQSHDTTGVSICSRGIKILTGHGDCIPTVPAVRWQNGEGERWRSAPRSHLSRLTSINRYTTCGDSIRKPLATDRLWANSCLGGAEKWEGSVYRDKITQWNPSPCSTLTRTGGCLTWHRADKHCWNWKFSSRPTKWQRNDFIFRVVCDKKNK